jgi:hypothetical protein
MPVGWLTMGTPENLVELLKRDPDGFADEVDKGVSAAGGVLIDILWNQSGTPAYVVVGIPATNPDDVYEKLERTFQTRVERLWSLQERKRHNLYGDEAGA